MNPDQQPQQFNPSQYDFITNPNQPKKKLFAGGSKLVLIALGLGVFTFVILILALVFGGGAGSDSDQLLRIGRQQSEVLRIAAVGDDKAGQTATKSYAKSIQLTLTSQQIQLTNYLETNENQKVNQSQLAATGNAEADQRLNAAASDGRFDDTFTLVMNESLKKYQSDLQNSFLSLNKEASGQLLAQFYEEIELIVQ